MIGKGKFCRDVVVALIGAHPSGLDRCGFDSEVIFFPGAQLKDHKSSFVRLAKKFEIKIYGFSFNFNHLHAVIQIPSREAYRRFIRALAAMMTQISGKTKLFTHVPFTRLATWGRDFRNLMNYLTLNDFEAEGVSKETGRILTKFWNADPPMN